MLKLLVTDLTADEVRVALHKISLAIPAMLDELEPGSWAQTEIDGIGLIVARLASEEVADGD